MTASVDIRWHDDGEPADASPPDLAASSHASRAALERILTDPHDDSAWGFLAETYDEMSAEWTVWAREQPWYAAPVATGLIHAQPTRLAVEVGCGTGQATTILDGLCPKVIATDINVSMLDGAPALPDTRYVAADVRRLPFRQGSVPLLVGLNAVPHVPEFQRVVAPGGQLLWCTSFGAGTPLYVGPDRLGELFGPGWRGDAGRSGHGEWLLLTRDG